MNFYSKTISIVLLGLSLSVSALERRMVRSDWRCEDHTDLRAALVFRGMTLLACGTASIVTGLGKATCHFTRKNDESEVTIIGTIEQEGYRINPYTTLGVILCYQGYKDLRNAQKYEKYLKRRHRIYNCLYGHDE